MRFNNTFIGLVAAFLGLYVFVTGYRMPGLNHLQFGPGFFPCLIGIGLMGTGVALIAERWFTGAPRRIWLEIDPRLRSRQALMGLLLMLGGIFFYIMVSEEAGFLLTGGVVLWINLWWFWRRPLAAIVVSLLTVVLIQIAFGSIMKVPLPMGWLESIQGVFSWK